MDTNDFDEFAAIAGTDLSEEGWWVYFTKSGFIEGVQSPFGTEPKTFDHYQKIRTYGELHSFLKLHNRIDLMKFVLATKPKFRGQDRRKVIKRIPK